MKKALKVILIIVVVIVILIAILIGVGVVYLNGIPTTHTGLEAAEKYRNDESGDYVHFTNDDFGEYESVTYNVKDKNGAFRSVGSMYTVVYSDSDYQNQMQRINSMNFVTASDLGDGAEFGNIFPAEQVSDDGWLLRIVKSDGENNYPKEIAMIATNDDKKTICYMYFSDGDLDFISEEKGEEALKKFIEENFNFKF